MWWAEEVTVTAISKVFSNTRHYKTEPKGKVIAIHCHKFGSKRCRKQTPQNPDELIEYGKLEGLSGEQENASLHGSLGVPNIGSHRPIL